MDDPIKRIHQQNVERVQASLDATRHTDSIEHLQSIENTVVGVVSKLVDFLEGNISRTEVVNQVRSVATPDVQKVVDAVVELGVITHSNRIDLSPLKDGLKELSEKLDKLPTDFPEAPKSLEVSNLKDIQFPEEKEIDLEPVLKAIQNIKMVAEAPNIQVDAPDLEPIKKGLTDVVKSIEAIKFPENKTDLSKVEKKLDESNKHLKAISEKKFGSSGGGGNGTPYIDSTGKPLNVELVNGAIPFTVASVTKRYDLSSSTIIYTATAPVGTAENTTGWTITKFDLTDTSNSSGKIATDVSWANRASGSYA